MAARPIAPADNRQIGQMAKSTNGQNGYRLSPNGPDCLRSARVIGTAFAGIVTVKALAAIGAFTSTWDSDSRKSAPGPPLAAARRRTVCGSRSPANSYSTATSGRKPARMRHWPPSCRRNADAAALEVDARPAVREAGAGGRSGVGRHAARQESPAGRRAATKRRRAPRARPRAVDPQAPRWRAASAASPGPASATRMNAGGPMGATPSRRIRPGCSNPAITRPRIFPRPTVPDTAASAVSVRTLRHAALAASNACLKSGNGSPGPSGRRRACAAHAEPRRHAAIAANASLTVLRPSRRQTGSSARCRRG